jgi:DNA-binding NarL/FixJ family response regulator
MQILIVDDFAPCRRLICSLLMEEPQLHVVAEAADGVEGVQKARELQPDLVLLDISLPKLNGIAAAKLMRRLCRTTKIIFVSQICDVDIVQAALREEAQGYILKAEVGRELVSAVKAVISGEKVVSRQLTDSCNFWNPAPVKDSRHVSQELPRS